MYENAAINILPQGAMKTAIPETLTIKSRFGAIDVHPDRSIFFPEGVLGMPDCKEFCLAEFPNAVMQQFKLLQSLNDQSICFVTLPLPVENQLIERADIEEACKVLDIRPESLALLLIASTHRTPESVSVSVNARAPLFIDTSKQLAVQYVFTNNKYQVRHKLG